MNDPSSVYPKSAIARSLDSGEIKSSIRPYGKFIHPYSHQSHRHDHAIMATSASAIATAAPTATAIITDKVCNKKSECDRLYTFMSKTMYGDVNHFNGNPSMVKACGYQHLVTETRRVLKIVVGNGKHIPVCKNGDSCSLGTCGFFHWVTERK